MATYRDIINRNDLTPEQKAQEIQAIGDLERKQIDRENLGAKARIGLGATLQGVSALPVFNIPYVGTGLGGALFESGNAIMQGKTKEDIAKDAGTGFVVGETVGVIPYVGKGLAKTKVGKEVLNKGGKLFDNLVNTKVGQKAAEIAPKVEDVLMTDITGKSIKGYHGTPNKFDKFDFNMVGTTTDDGMLGNGIYFTAYPDVAQTYAKNNGSVKKAYLDFKNPLILENKKQLDEINAIIEPKIPSNTIEDIQNGTKLYSQAFKNYLEEKGYDSVIDNIGRKGEQYVAYKPEQIKIRNLKDSVDKSNMGAFINALLNRRE